MTINPDFQNLLPLDPTVGLSYEEKISKIFAHEKEYRGIDWLQLSSRGPAGLQQAKQLAHAHLRQFQQQLDLADEQIPAEVQSLLRSMASDSAQASDGADVMTMWPLTAARVQQWEAATGSQIKDLVATQISAMQSIQTVKDEPALIAQISLGIGVAAWVRTAWVAFQATRALAGATEVYAILTGIIEAGTAIVVFTVTTVILAVLIPILLLMLKDATCFMVVINKSPDDLTVEGDVDLTHGNLNIQFTDYDVKRRLPGASVILNPSGQPVSSSYWSGILVAQKKSGALFGSQGAFKFAATTCFPSGLYIGWEIPLTIFGGDNRCLVAADFTGDLGTFSNRTNDHGSASSSSTLSTGSIAARMNASGGSQGYMVTVVSGPAPAAA